MAKYREPVCRLCRREGGKLFLKGSGAFQPSVRSIAGLTLPVRMGGVSSTATGANLTLHVSYVQNKKRSGSMVCWNVNSIVTMLSRFTVGE